MASPERTVIELEGAVDRNTVPKIRKNLLSTIRKKKKHLNEFVLDFSQVTKMDTAGVAMLVELYRILSKRKSRLRVTHLSEKSKQVIELARLGELFEV